MYIYMVNIRRYMKLSNNSLNCCLEFNVALVLFCEECIFSSFYFYFSDINECEGDRAGRCQHICVDTATSYKCVCRDGYRLLTDRHNCRGTFAIKILK
jgi:hypothetical protein